MTSGMVILRGLELSDIQARVLGIAKRIAASDPVSYLIHSPGVPALNECRCSGGTCDRLCLTRSFATFFEHPAATEDLLMHPRLNTGVRSTNSSVCLLAIVSALSVAAAACGQNQPKPGTVRDEAMLAARTAASFQRELITPEGIDLTVIYAAHSVAHRAWSVEPAHRHVFLRGLSVPGAERRRDRAPDVSRTRGQGRRAEWGKTPSPLERRNRNSPNLNRLSKSAAGAITLECKRAPRPPGFASVGTLDDARPDIQLRRQE
jgi:hypothetical protein